MLKEKFKMILDKDEEIKWCGGVNVSACVKRSFLNTFLLGLFPPVAILMLGVPYGWLFLILSLLNIIPMWIGIIHFLFSISVCISWILLVNMNEANTFCCITNKRFIKRSGAFNNKFVHYSLKNVGTVKIEGDLFDSKGENPSASLSVTVKDYHSNTDDDDVICVDSLNNAYEAYKILNELVEGNNENLRIKIEK